ncbi:META domain-containing protein [Hymenobacter psychrophilus]|uniref:Heat shock protein HslJ n=1 Tax=Hymenobacter psychrophilus TaxID=651662 RepID=A0A1H3L2I3_9BACT|nr:META domain-containing protein [Hymenobacter psychrophilus]SDY58429.1 Heat shock protein HslJ [Hymenobacter psychrophilus]
MLSRILLLGATLLAAACQATGPATSATGPATTPTTADTTTPPAPGPTSAVTEPAGGGSEKLFAHRWALTEVAGQPVAPTGDAREAHLLFFPPDRVGGSTGCNRLNGSFELLAGGQLKFSPLATTRMLCPGPAAVETRLIQALGTVQTYYVTDAALELRAGTAVVARFQAAPAGPEK